MYIFIKRDNSTVFQKHVRQEFSWPCGHDGFVGFLPQFILMSEHYPCEFKHNLYGDEYYYHPLEAQSMLFIQVVSH